VALRTARSWGMPPTAMLSARRARDIGWTEEDVLLALAHTEREDGMCGRCGHPLAESASPSADPDNPLGTHTYRVGPPTRCHACTALARAEEPVVNPRPGAAGAPHPSALHWHSTRVERPRR
jgi:hypothetical protein